MTPSPNRASWWCSVTTLGHTYSSVASTDSRSNRRTLLRALLLNSGAPGVHCDAPAKTLVKDIQRTVDALDRLHQVVGLE